VIQLYNVDKWNLLNYINYIILLSTRITWKKEKILSRKNCKNKE